MLTENGQELEAVQLIIKLRKQGLSMAKIAAELTRRKVPTKTGGGWYANTVQYILKNNLYGKVA